MLPFHLITVHLYLIKISYFRNYSSHAYIPATDQNRQQKHLDCVTPFYCVSSFDINSKLVNIGKKIGFIQEQGTSSLTARINIIYKHLNETVPITIYIEGSSINYEIKNKFVVGSRKSSIISSAKHIMNNKNRFNGMFIFGVNKKTTKFDGILVESRNIIFKVVDKKTILNYRTLHIELCEDELRFENYTQQKIMPFGQGAIKNLNNHLFVSLNSLNMD